MADKLHSWQVPAQAAEERYKIGWLNEHCEEGLSWQRSQRGFGDWRKAMDILSGKGAPEVNTPAYRSQLSTGRLKRNIKEVVGSSANIRPIWAYNTANDSLQPKAAEMNKTVRAIYLEQFLDQSIKQALQWSASTCTGWLRPVYRRDIAGTGKGNINFYTYGSASILPAQLPSNGNWQEAYAVTVMDEMPIWMAHGMFPKFQERLLPTKSQLWHSQEIRTAAKGNLFQRMWNSWRSNKDALLSELYIPVRYTYINDLAINRTGSPIQMGPWGVDTMGKPIPTASWSYEVPSVGAPIPTSSDSLNRMQFREADENDARLYPNRRLIISSEDVVMYDGPAFDWHGELPLIPFTLDDWAWEPLGLGIVRDGYNIQAATDEIDRGTMDKVRAGLDMALAYDINSGVSRNEADMFDPMQPRARIGYDGSTVETPFKPVVPPEVLRLDPMAMQFREVLTQTGDYQLGINSIQALAKARALGGGMDEVEKLLQADGPIVRDISRNIERSISRVGYQMKYLILQYYTTKRVMDYVGVNGVARETFDFDPNRLVPSHMPDEPTEGGRASIYSSMQRAKWFAEQLRFFILPHSAHEIAQMSYKLGLVQLRKAGIPIDSQTIAEAWNLELGANFVSNSPYDRYWEEQEKMAQHALRIKMIVDSIQQQGVTPPEMLMAAAAQAGEAAGQATGQNPEGRPPSGLEAPRVVSKDGGARSAVSQSGT